MAYILVWKKNFFFFKRDVYSLVIHKYILGLLELVCSKNWSDTSSVIMGVWSFVLPLWLFVFLSWYLDHILTRKSVVTWLLGIRLLILWYNDIITIFFFYFAANEKIREIKSKPKNTAQMVSFDVLIRQVW